MWPRTPGRDPLLARLVVEPSWPRRDPLAHGLVARTDLPIPEWLFGWAAAMVLVVSFVALAILWPEPRLQEEGWRPLPGGFGRRLAQPAAWRSLCGAIGVFLLGVVVYSGLRGTQTSTANFAPTFVYVIFWLGLVPASVLLGRRLQGLQPVAGDRAGGAWVARPRLADDLPAPLRVPRAAWALARCGGHLRLRGDGARGLERRQAGEPRDRDADLLGRDLRRDGALRRRGLDRARRGLLGLLQSLLAAFGDRDAATVWSGCGGRCRGCRRSTPCAGHGGAAGGDDRLGDLRRRRGGAALDRHRARHLAASSRTSACRRSAPSRRPS